MGRKERLFVETSELLGAVSTTLTNRDLHFNNTVAAGGFIFSSNIPNTRINILNGLLRVLLEIFSDALMSSM
jgi:hypothetical protein